MEFFFFFFKSAETKNKYILDTMNVKCLWDLLQEKNTV